MGVREGISEIESLGARFKYICISNPAEIKKKYVFQRLVPLFTYFLVSVEK